MKKKKWNGPTLPCAHLGVVFKHICETRGISPEETADGLTSEGFDVTPTACREIEEGLYLPHDGETFACMPESATAHRRGVLGTPDTVRIRRTAPGAWRALRAHSFVRDAAHVSE